MLRLELAKKLNLLKKGDYALVWVTKFPLLEFNEEEGRLESVHHPFTSPLEEDLSLLQDHPDKVRARAYDIVLNGSEIGGGSVRIHNPALQETMFKLLGISQEEANLKFGFFLEALKYGAPPHAGIALGLDRLAAILTGSESIREVIAFLKTQTASMPSGAMRPRGSTKAARRTRACHHRTSATEEPRNQTPNSGGGVSSRDSLRLR